MILRWARSLDDRDTALGMLSDAERRRYDAAPSDTFLLGRLLLRRLVGELTGVAPEDVPLVAVCPDCGGPHGRPAVVGSALHVSLSHSAVAVVAAASWDGPVGVDVEPLKVSDEALTAVGMLAGEGSLERWTRVEAVLKADGRGLRVDPALVLFEGDTATVSGSPARYRVSEVQLAPDVRVSVAVEV
ncbi:4'-phosphopantetheinyl transferase superfamily protein [soil metagenome]